MDLVIRADGYVALEESVSESKLLSNPEFLIDVTFSILNSTLELEVRKIDIFYAYIGTFFTIL